MAKSTEHRNPKLAASYIEKLWGYVQMDHFYSVPLLLTWSYDYPEVATRFGVTNEGLRQAFRSYANLVRTLVDSDGYYGFAFEIYKTIHNPRYGLTWDDAGIDEPTLTAWIRQETRENLQTFRRGSALTLSTAFWLLDLIYDYPGVHGVMSDDQIREIVDWIVAWANQAYRELSSMPLHQDMPLPWGETYLVALHDIQPERERRNPSVQILPQLTFSATQAENLFRQRNRNA